MESAVAQPCTSGSILGRIDWGSVLKQVSPDISAPRSVTQKPPAEEDLHSLTSQQLGEVEISDPSILEYSKLRRAQ